MSSIENITKTTKMAGYLSGMDDTSKFTFFEIEKGSGNKTKKIWIEKI